MPTDAASLRVAAARAERDAADARDAALALERHNRALEHRLTPVLERHTPEVWTSQAATASRLRLRVSAVGTLNRARASITDIVAQVQRRAEILDLTASDYRREANRLDALAADAAAAAALAGIEPPPVFDPADAGDVSVPHGVR